MLKLVWCIIKPPLGPGWECVQRNHHEQWQMVEEMEGWSAGAPQGNTDDTFFNTNNHHHISESEVEDLDLPKLVVMDSLV